MKFKTRIVLVCSLVTFFFTAALPVFAADTTASCSLADINQALRDDLTCSTEGTVFFGTSVTQFVLNQCSTITNPGEGSGAVDKSHKACIVCAKKAWVAFQAAKKAGLLPSSSDAGLSTSKIKQLCRISDDGQDDDGNQPPASEALQNMYNQIRLCFPQEGQTIDTTQCVQCAAVVLNDAFSAGVINQAKYTVLKQSIKQVCSDQGSNGEHDQPTPTPTPNPGDGNGGNNFDQFYAGLRSCFAQFHSATNLNPEGCASCVNALSTDGLDPTRLNTILPYARNACQRSFEQN